MQHIHFTQKMSPRRVLQRLYSYWLMIGRRSNRLLHPPFLHNIHITPTNHTNRAPSPRRLYCLSVHSHFPSDYNPVFFFSLSAIATLSAMFHQKLDHWELCRVSNGEAGTDSLPIPPLSLPTSYLSWSLPSISVVPFVFRSFVSLSFTLRYWLLFITSVQSSTPTHMHAHIHSVCIWMPSLSDPAFSLQC